jgi:predicted TPR repeat methyltransferase
MPYWKSTATFGMAMRVWPKEQLSAEEAQQRLRGSFSSLLKQYMESHNMISVDRMVDVGCSVGVSTQYMQKALRPQHMYGVDLSPYMLAVAQARESERQVW